MTAAAHDRRAVEASRTAGVLYLVTLLSAWPIGAVVADATPQPAGACSGIGFGCSLYGWDAAAFVLLYVGAPYALGLGLLVGLLGLLPPRWRAIQTAAAAGGLVFPWLLAAVIAALSG
jgi:hypothetical protein